MSKSSNASSPTPKTRPAGLGRRARRRAQASRPQDGAGPRPARESKNRAGGAGIRGRARRPDARPHARRAQAGLVRQAKRDFEAARGDFEQRLGALTQASERLAEEAALVDFLAPGSSIRMAAVLTVPIGGVQGLAREVPVADALAALREQMFDLEANVLLGARNDG